MKKMNLKQWIGAALVVVGIGALILSHSIRGQVGEEMGKVKTILNPISQTGQAGRLAGGIIEERSSGEAARYLQNAQFLMIGGAVLIVIGGCLIFLCKKKR